MITNQDQADCPGLKVIIDWSVSLDVMRKARLRWGAELSEKADTTGMQIKVGQISTDMAEMMTMKSQLEGQDIDQGSSEVWNHYFN